MALSQHIPQDVHSALSAGWGADGVGKKWLLRVDEAEKFGFALPLRQNVPSVTKMRKRDAA
jgi:hypothetical protein